MLPEAGGGEGALAGVGFDRRACRRLAASHRRWFHQGRHHAILWRLKQRRGYRFFPNKQSVWDALRDFEHTHWGIPSIGSILVCIDYRGAHRDSRHSKITAPVCGDLDWLYSMCSNELFAISMHFEYKLHLNLLFTLFKEKFSRSLIHS